MTRIGIPRALLYYNFYPAWESFFKVLGVEVVFSGETTKKTINFGTTNAIDETCLPVKVFYGHVSDLINKKVDFVFVPRIVSIEKKAFICPKLLGLPDVIRSSFGSNIKIISPTVNLNVSFKKFLAELWQVGREFTNSNYLITKAIFVAFKSLKKYEEKLQSGFKPCGDGKSNFTKEQKPARGKIVVLGHPYVLYDQYINMNLLQRLAAKGFEVVTPEMLKPKLVKDEAKKLRKNLFWTLGKRIVGGGKYYFKQDDITGIIYLAVFGCGPDSIIGELVESDAARYRNVPFMTITLDEHSGEAGLVTRLEAFLDMIAWRSVG